MGWFASTAGTVARAPGSSVLLPGRVAGVRKVVRNQELVLVSGRARVTRAFRTTLGLPGRMAVRLQPNHGTDDARAILASIVDGLMYGCGDAVIGINPAGDNLANIVRLLQMLDELRLRHDIPTQSCVLTHVTQSIAAIERGAPVDLVVQLRGGPL